MTSTIVTYVQAHWLVALAVFNVAMSALAQLFVAIGKAEPAFLQSVGAWGLKITQWLSANTPTPPATPKS